MQTPTVIQNISKLDKCIEEIPERLEHELDDFFSTNRITIVYAGNVRSDSKVEELIQSLEENCKLYNVLIVGDGECLPRIRELSLTLKNVKLFLTGTLPFNMLGTVLKRCNIAYMYYPITNLNNKFCSPNKLYEYASIGLPTICNNNPTIHEVYDKWNIGVCNDNILEAVNECVKNIDCKRQNCYNFNEAYTWEKEKKKLREFCIEVFNEKKS